METVSFIHLYCIWVIFLGKYNTKVISNSIWHSCCKSTVQTKRACAKVQH